MLLIYGKCHTNLYNTTRDYVERIDTNHLITLLYVLKTVWGDIDNSLEYLLMAAVYQKPQIRKDDRW